SRAQRRLFKTRCSARLDNPHGDRRFVGYAQARRPLARAHRKCRVRIRRRSASARAKRARGDRLTIGHLATAAGHSAGEAAGRKARPSRETAAEAASRRSGRRIERQGSLMKPMRVAAVVLVALAVRVEASPEQRGSEREEREREEREERARNPPKEAEKAPSAADEKEALYALGAILGQKIGGYHLSPKELQIVERGFTDAAANRKLMLRDPDLDEWGPKVDAVLGRRANPQVAAEKDR